MRSDRSQRFHARIPGAFSTRFVLSVVLALAGTWGAVVSQAEEDVDLTSLVEKAEAPRLVGTWKVVITAGDGAIFPGYYSFFADGNASFSSAGPPVPALGNPGYGVWKQVGAGRFAVTIEQNTFDETLQLNGSLKLLAEIRLTTRNSFVTMDRVFVYDPDGNEVFTGGGEAQGRRMMVERIPSP